MIKTPFKQRENKKICLTDKVMRVEPRLFRESFFKMSIGIESGIHVIVQKFLFLNDREQFILCKILFTF